MLLFLVGVGSGWSWANACQRGVRRNSEGVCPCASLNARLNDSVRGSGASSPGTGKPVVEVRQLRRLRGALLDPDRPLSQTSLGKKVEFK